MNMSPTLPSTFRSVLARYASPLLPLEAAPRDRKGGRKDVQKGWRRCMTLPADALIFAGHFPGHPVVPAVVQCLMAQMAIEEGLGRTLRLKAICQAKFTAALGPDQTISLRVVSARKPGQWDCTLHAGDTPAASLRLELEETAV